MTQQLFRLSLLSALALPLVGCGGGIDDLALNALYPFEQANKIAVPDEPPAGYEQGFVDVRTPDEGDFKVHYWSFVKKNSPQAPVIFYFHGNGENLGSIAQSGMLNLLESLGGHLVIMDYPAYGKSTGKPSQASILASFQALADQTEESLPQSKILVWGYSLGAAVALHAARDPRVEKFVITSAFTDIKAMAKAQFGGIADSISEELYGKHLWDNKAIAGTIDKQGLQFHGTADEFIEISMGQSLNTQFSEGLVPFDALQGKTHNNVFSSSEMLSKVRQFFK